MKKTLKIFAILFLALLIYIYISGLYFFKDRFLPKTFVNGHDFGLTKISEFQDNYNNLSKNFVLEVVDKDNKSEKITAKEISYVEDIGKNVINQTPFYWPISSLINKEFKTDTDLKYNEIALENKINNLNSVKNGNIESVNAKVVYSPEEDKYKIQDEVFGNIVRRDDLKKSVLNHFADKTEKLSLKDENLYYDPTITSDSDVLKHELKSTEEIHKRKLVIDLGDVKEELTGQKLISLYSKSENGDLVLDDLKVEEYAKSLSASYDTYKGSRIFNATDLGPVKVDGGIYGWSTDVLKTKEAIVNAINTGAETVQPVYRQTALARAGGDIGKTYIEIDLARQTLWYYKDGNLKITTPIVSGNPRQGNATPTGTDRIWSREKDRYLTGETYRSKVNYWMPINWKGIGLHDATWRSKFGGNLYLSGGSHGCINVPPSVMPGLFAETFNGMPVVVYDSNRQKV